MHDIVQSDIIYSISVRFIIYGIDNIWLSTTNSLVFAAMNCVYCCLSHKYRTQKSGIYLRNQW